MLESPATDPGRAAEGMQEVRYHRAVIDTLRQELVTERKLVKGFEADLIAARKERDEATRLLRVLNEETVLAGYPCGDRDRTLANLRALRSDFIALAKMYGEACTELHRLWAALDWDDEAFGMYTFRRMRERAEAAEADAAQLRARLHEAEKALRPFAGCVFNDNGDVTVSTGHLTTHDWLAAKRARAALTPAPEANQEAGDGR